MTKEKMDACVAEAKRFLKAAQLLKDRMARDDAGRWALMGSKESGAMRRVSMDLSRALAELRKGRD